MDALDRPLRRSGASFLLLTLLWALPLPAVASDMGCPTFFIKAALTLMVIPAGMVWGAIAGWAGSRGLAGVGVLVGAALGVYAIVPCESRSHYGVAPFLAVAVGLATWLMWKVATYGGDPYEDFDAED